MKIPLFQFYKIGYCNKTSLDQYRTLIYVLENTLFMKEFITTLQDLSDTLELNS